MEPSSKLSPTETARELGVARTTVYDMVSRGLIPARKISRRRIVIEREDLARYLAAAVIVPKETVHP